MNGSWVARTGGRRSGARIAFVVLVGLVIAACGSDEPAAGTPADGGERTAPETEGGDPPAPAPRDEGTVGFPAMPDDVPVYPGAEHTIGTRVGSQTVGSWKTSDAPEVVAAHYAERLPAAGWSVDRNDGSAMGATIHASKEGRKLTVAITRALPAGSVVNLSHRP